MKSFKPNRVYLAQWNILDEFPELRRDFAVRRLWPGLRWRHSVSHLDEGSRTVTLRAAMAA